MPSRPYVGLIREEPRDPPEKRDYAAYSELFTMRYVPLCQYAAGFVDSDTAEDMVATLFLRIWRNREHTPLRAIRPTYLFRGIDNEIRHFLQHERIDRGARRRRTELPLPHPPIDPSWETARHELAAAIQTSVKELPPRTRETFLLIKHAGLTYPEAAEALNVSPKTVESQMHRAFAILREALAFYR